eukprot:scaffold643099_cov25-Prasinocladus_malaysianus.AAC.1
MIYGCQLKLSVHSLNYHAVAPHAMSNAMAILPVHFLGNKSGECCALTGSAAADHCHAHAE